MGGQLTQQKQLPAAQVTWPIPRSKWSLRRSFLTYFVSLSHWKFPCSSVRFVCFNLCRNCSLFLSKVNKFVTWICVFLLVGPMIWWFFCWLLRVTTSWTVTNRVLPNADTSCNVALNQNQSIKNPNWPEANQMATCKRGQEFELGPLWNKCTKWSERDSNPGPRFLSCDYLWDCLVRALNFSEST